MLFLLVKRNASPFFDDFSALLTIVCQQRPSWSWCSLLTIVSSVSMQFYNILVFLLKLAKNKNLVWLTFQITSLGSDYMVMALLFKLSFPRKRKPGYVSRHRLATLRILDLISEKGHRTTERENFPFLLSPSSGRFFNVFPPQFTSISSPFESSHWENSPFHRACVVIRFLFVLEFI